MIAVWEPKAYLFYYSIYKFYEGRLAENEVAP